MSTEKNVEASDLIASGPISDSSLNISENDMEKDGIPFNSASAVGDATSGNKVVNRTSALEKGVYYPTTSSYDYYYPGYSGRPYGPSDDKEYYNTSGGSYAGIESDDNAHLYYYPGYGPYQTGTDYSYGSDAFYSYDSTYSGNVSTGQAAKYGSVKPVMGGPSGSGKSNGYNNSKTNSRKAPELPFNSNIQQSYNFSNRNQHPKPLNKLGSNFQTSGLMKGYRSTSNFTNRNPGVFMQYTPVNYQSSGRAVNSNYRNKSREETTDKYEEADSLMELTRGPRSETMKKSPAAANETDRYNSRQFQIQYDDAKFYVIKSYSEDDVHKCIKYDVWSSTPNGNKKLDAAFREADAKTNETGKKCPVFLFFSVNGSGQFLGVAEMIGQVDFSKNMDFWQLDKWSGFFPIKWHVIKDVPNALLRHIILENNDNRSVTYSRDTQEIGLKQGLEMLGIFKSYSERTSVLDDFNFYENREKSLRAKRIAKAGFRNNASKNGDYKKHFEADEGIAGEQSAKTRPSDPSSLISLTENLSISSQPLQSSI